MSLEVTVTIKAGPGHGAPWTVVRGTPDDVAGYLGLHGEDWDGKGSTLSLQLNKVAAYVAGEFDKLGQAQGKG